jgi:hypothetical protein
MSDVRKQNLPAGATVGTANAVAGADRETVKPAHAEAVEPAVTVTSSDPRYADLTVGNNTRWRASPESVRIVSSTEQVVQAVQEAVRAGKRLSVKGGGHCYADFVFHPEVRVIIDMSEMNNVSFDSACSAFVVEAGGELLDVYQSLYKRWGVTIPGGMCYSVGAGGHICGGGYGLLSRRHGLTVDHLYAIEIVVVDRAGMARAVLATRNPNDPNRELWWAHTGGGGGNFGVVTRYFFRSPGASGPDPSALLVRPPAEVLVSAIGLPWSSLDSAAFRSLVRGYAGWHVAHSTADDPYASLCSFLMMNHRSNDRIGLLTVIDAGMPNAKDLLDGYLRVVTGNVAAAEPVRGPVGEFGAMPELFEPQRLPWLQSMKYLGTNNPILTTPTMRGSHKSSLHRGDFTDAQVATMYRQLTLTDYQNPAAMVVLLSYGGKINTVGSAETAAAQRSSAFKGLFQAFWGDAAEDDRHIDWTRAVYGGVYADTGGYPVPNDVTDGCYINYPDVDITNPQVNKSGVPWSTLYYKDNYPRLRQIKAKYDPLNVFRHSQSIELSPHSPRSG